MVSQSFQFWMVYTPHLPQQEKIIPNKQNFSNSYPKVLK